MQITFDPNNAEERSLIASVLSVWDNGSDFEPVKPFNVGATDETMTAVPETVTVDAATPVEGVVMAEEAPVAVSTPLAATGETDSHGMVWDDAIHSTPATKNADGSWRAKRGKKDEYEAAIAAHKSGTTAAAGASMTAPAGTAMPMPGMPPAPAAPVPQTPAEPIAYDEMAKRFVAMMDSGGIADYAQVYTDLGVDHTQVEQNQTMIAHLWHYMDAINAGADHANAVTMAKTNVG